MMRSELLRKIEREAKHLGVIVTLSERGRHSKLTVCEVVIWLPRHLRISYGIEQKIPKDLESVFGKGWYRK